MNLEGTRSFLHRHRLVATGICGLLLGIGFAAAALAEPGEVSRLAMVKTGPEGVEWSPEVRESGFVLTVSGPGKVFQREFPAGKNPRLAVRDKKHGVLADGHYSWELRAAPKVDGIFDRRRPEVRIDENGRPVEGKKKPMAAKGSFSQSGSFSIVEGAIVDLGSREPLPDIRQTGSLEVAGDLLVDGKKSFRAADPAGGAAIVYVALEGPEAGTYFRGTAKTVDGRAEIELPAHFSKVTEAEGLTAQLTPLAGWSRLYVEAVSPERLIVRDAEGTNGVAFDFLVQGVRKGYAGHVVERSSHSR